MVARGETVGASGPGLCVLLGVAADDVIADAERLAEKIARLRIFENDAGKFDLSLLDVGGGSKRERRREGAMANGAASVARPIGSRFITSSRYQKAASEGAGSRNATRRSSRPSGKRLMPSEWPNGERR